MSGAVKWTGYLPQLDAATRSEWRVDHEPWPEPEPAPVSKPVVVVDEPSETRWMRLAACRGMDPDLFHPEKTAGQHTKIAAAKEVCRGCPVRAECLDYAIEHNEKQGVWGGETERNRRRLKSIRRNQPTATVKKKPRAPRQSETLTSISASYQRALEKRRAS